MDSRLRIAAFGLLGALVVAGAACAATVAGITGEVLAIVLISAGLGGALLLVFLEIGLGEERDLARDERVRATRTIRRLAVLRRGGPSHQRRRSH